MTQTTHVVETQAPQGIGLERIVDLASTLFLVGSSIFVIRGGILGEAAAIVSALYGLVLIITILVFLRAVADILRVLKHSAGLPVHGTISGHGTRPRRSCGACGAELFSATRCEMCGREIVVESADAGSGHQSVVAGDDEPRAPEGSASP